MGLPARKLDAPASKARTPHLRVVKSAPKKARTRGSSKAASAQAARRAFRFFTVFAITFALLGVGRVWLSVEAAEASMAANELRNRIESERYEGDMLEVRQSALGSPSRIRAIAGQAMGMAPAGDVTYLELGQASVAEADEGVRPVRSGFEKVLSDVMDLAAGEAEVLLVGDVGLASTR